MVSVSDEDYLSFVDRAVRGMAGIAADLGDDRACAKPALPGANTAYGLLTHCLGVIEYWAGGLVAGREVERDRASEFVATGALADLLVRVDEVLARLAVDVRSAESDQPLRRLPDAWAAGPDRPLTQGGVLLHVYEEVAQHHGQLEVLRDALRGSVPEPSAPALSGPPLSDLAPSDRPLSDPQASDPALFDPPMDWLRAKRGVKWRRPGPDLIPAWVADMDFPVAPPIRAAITAMLDRGDLGYSDWSQQPLADAFVARMSNSFGWTAERAHVRPVGDLIQALGIVLDLATTPRDGVLAHLPNYPPFPAIVARMGRRLAPVQLIAAGESWTWDEEAFERAAADARVLLLVNPHNPTGRVFSRAELHRLADVARARDLLVISDEIHAELVHDPHLHVPFATLGPDTAARTVTLTSATKAYNIAGVRTAVAHVGPAWLRERWDAKPPNLYGLPSTIGVEATVAAWRDCDEWLGGLRAHLRGQRDHLVRRVADMPTVSMRVPDAGYLAWLDCRAAGLPEEAADFFRTHAGLELAPGPDYDPAAEGWVRLNYATSRAVLDEILDRMCAALGSL